MPGRRLSVGLTIACVVYLAYFVTTFFVDNSNESDVLRYTTQLVQDLGRHAVSRDVGGRYTLLAEYSLGALIRAIQALGSHAAPRRAFLVMRMAQGLAVFAAAYLYFAALRLSWFLRMVGLMLLSICLAYASLVAGWEMDKIDEVILFLVGGVAALRGWFGALAVLVAAAALNRETGVLMPLLYPALARGWTGDRASWLRFGLLVAVALAIVVPLELLSGGLGLRAGVTAGNLNPATLSAVDGGLAFLPLGAGVAAFWAPRPIQRAFLLVAPAWLILAVVTEPLGNGSLLLAPVALLCIPVVLVVVQRGALAVRAEAAVATQPSADHRSAPDGD